MSAPESHIERTYGHRLRLRVCGLCFDGDDLLMVKHQGLGANGTLFAPPGGGMQYGESAEAALVRETKEETGLEVKVKRFLFVHEIFAPPLHAVELFFEMEADGGTLATGSDPEASEAEQIIEKVSWMSPEALSEQPAGQVHRMIAHYLPPLSLLSCTGYFEFDNKTRN